MSMLSLCVYYDLYGHLQFIQLCALLKNIYFGQIYFVFCEIL